MYFTNKNSSYKSVYLDIGSLLQFVYPQKYTNSETVFPKSKERT